MPDVKALSSQLDLTRNQVRNGLGIIAAVKARKWPMKAAIIAVEVALAESGMRMLASANVPASQKYPHDKLGWTYDGLGHDHASMGMFQQQTGTKWTPAGYGYAMNQTTMRSKNGWGTPAELMDPEKSTAKFLNALSHVNWRDQDPWVAGQNVQRSAYDGNPRRGNNYSSTYGGNYKGQHKRAVRIVAVLWDQVGAPAAKPPAKPTPKPTPTKPPTARPPARPPVKKPAKPSVRKRRMIGTYTVVSNDTLAKIAHRYVQRDVTWRSIAKDNKISNPNKIHVGQKLTIKSGV